MNSKPKVQGWSLKSRFYVQLILQDSLARSHQIFDVTCQTDNCKTHYWMRYWKILLKSGRPSKILQDLAKSSKIPAQKLKADSFVQYDPSKNSTRRCANP